MMGSKQVDHWTSGTVYECSEIPGSPHALIFVFVSLKIFPEFHFILFRFEVFAIISFCFRFISFSFRFRFLCFASMQNKRKWRHTLARAGHPWRPRIQVGGANEVYGWKWSTFGVSRYFHVQSIFDWGSCGRCEFKCTIQEKCALDASTTHCNIIYITYHAHQCIGVYVYLIWFLLM